jgi:predicted small lipoprotein YifL
MSAARFIAIACAAVFMLSACGNKGDLVMPPVKPAKPQTAPPTPPPTDTPQKPATSP